MKLVVVGGGLAAHRAVQALARDGFDGDVVVVGDEPHHPYDRPPLSKKFLAGEVDADECAYKLEDLDHVSWELERPAVALDADGHSVELADGERVDYDRLLIATGRGARGWPEPLDLDGFFTLRDMADSRALAEAATAGTRVAIIGAGFIGCEVAATLSQRGLDEITVIEMAGHPLPVIGAEAGKRAAALHEEHGVKLELGTSVEGFDGNGSVQGVRLEGGRTVDADLVLLALGSAPNTAWLEDSALTLEAGSVVCDEHCLAVGVEDIAAAGDAAAWPHPDAGGELVSVEHWTNARDMGPAAARNLVAGAQDRKPFAAIPTFWSDQYDVRIKSAGFLDRADSFTVVDEDPSDHGLVVEAHREGELVGALAFNRNKTLLGYQRDLKERVTA